MPRFCAACGTEITYEVCKYCVDCAESEDLMDEAVHLLNEITEVIKESLNEKTSV